MVAIHATRAAETVPFLPEIIEHATHATTGGAPADDTRDAASVQFVLAITGGIDGNGGGGGVISAGRKCSTNNRFCTVAGRPDTAMLRREVADIADRHVLLCGPDLFMTAMEKALKELGVPSSRIHSEEFYF